MGKIGRIRKHSHWNYKENRQVSSGKISSTTSTLPLKYQLSLCDIPLAVLNQPSIVNYSSVFSVLSKDNLLNHKWNLIEHTNLFMMLCTFTPGVTPPLPEKTIIINLDCFHVTFMFLELCWKTFQMKSLIWSILSSSWTIWTSVLVVLEYCVMGTCSNLLCQEGEMESSRTKKGKSGEKFLRMPHV